MKPCSAGYQRCDDGLQCISEDLVCDGIYNCRDKSDEKQCGKLIQTRAIIQSQQIHQPNATCCNIIKECSKLH